MPLQLVTLPLYCARRRNNHLGLPSSSVAHRHRHHTRRRFSPAFSTYLALVCIPRRSTRDFRGRLRRCRSRDGKYTLSETRSRTENSWGTIPPLCEVNFQLYRAQDRVQHKAAHKNQYFSFPFLDTHVFIDVNVSPISIRYPNSEIFSRSIRVQKKFFRFNISRLMLSCSYIS